MRVRSTAEIEAAIAPKAALAASQSHFRCSENNRRASQGPAGRLVSHSPS